MSEHIILLKPDIAILAFQQLSFYMHITCSLKPENFCALYLGFFYRHLIPHGFTSRYYDGRGKEIVTKVTM